MKGIMAAFSVIMALNPAAAFAQSGHEQDIIQTDSGDLRITFLGHGSLMMEHNGIVVHIDPYSKVADYSVLPKADLILLTHHHGDHLDEKAIRHIRSDKTGLILTEICKKTLGTGKIMRNGDKTDFMGIGIEAVPAYNIKHKRDNGEPFHVPGEGNGYILQFSDKRVYVAGDTENIPEMKSLGKIHCAFLPVNLPYTMTPQMASEAAETIMPGILYPYHFGSTDTSEIVKLLADEKSIEVRIRKME